jgi:hypothetical protein
VAPTREAVEALADPYPNLPVRGTVKDDERAAAAVKAVSKALHYGSAPVAALQLHATEAWCRTLVLLLGKGDEPQVKAAWEIVNQGFMKDEYLPTQFRFEMAKSQARIWDYQHAKLDDALMKRAYLAEIAWALYGLDRARPDGGHH